MQKYLYRFKWFVIVCYQEFCRRFLKRRVKIDIKYNGKSVMTPKDTNKYIYNNILNNPDRGFLVGRFGAGELFGFAKFDPDMGSLRSEEKVLNKLRNNTGFFPATREAGVKYAEEMKNACAQLDMLAVWHIPMEDYAVKLYSGDIVYGSPTGMEPYYFDDPWTKILSGKKVLVIHPFADSIQKQYCNNREKLFKNPNILPQFELHTLPAVQTIAGNEDDRFADWFEALDYMENEAMKIDFDVAIVGCGAYGFPLCARLKKHGKIAIHMGGATQMMFGVKGARWENSPAFKHIINDCWIRPSQTEVPQNANRVENGCYW